MTAPPVIADPYRVRGPADGASTLRTMEAVP